MRRNNMNYNGYVSQLVNGGIYNLIKYEEFKAEKYDESSELHKLFKLIEGSTPIELYCKQCKKDRVFKPCISRRNLFSSRYKRAMAEKELKNSLNSLPLNDVDEYDVYIDSMKKATGYSGYEIYECKYKCAFDNNHEISLFLCLTLDGVMKVGQYPSFTDLQNTDEIKRYRPLLGEEYYREYKKALGLFSHDVGIGAFVYLRRIIERLVYNAFIEAEKAKEISTTDFETENGKQRKFVSKIKLLNNYLPKLLVSNANMYGIVSKGIHELSDDECLSYFPIINNGIKLILNDMIEMKEKAKEENQFKKDIDMILTNVVKEKNS